jgi:flagellar biosynthesis protein FlhB
MSYTLAITALAFVFAGALVAALAQKYFTKYKTEHTPDGFLLADKNLGKSSVLSLFLSSSFGMAALFYAVWLGYTVGFWGFMMQAAWSLGFLLLVPHVKKIKSADSLHDFLGRQFGDGAKLLSAICYLLSILFLMAWEVRIAQKPMAALLPISNTGSIVQTLRPDIFAIASIISVVLFYTLVGGLKGNATVDKFLNLTKIVSIVLLSFLLAANFSSFARISFSHALFPPVSAIKENLGVWGLITNLLLNLFSQFTDGSSWQNIIASSRHQNSQRNLKVSSILIFLSIGFFGSFIGILLAGVPGITTDNIITAPLKILPGYTPVIGFITLVLIATCIMSLLNSTLLVTTRIVSINFLHLNNNNNLKTNSFSAKQKMHFIKILLVVIAITSIGGINYIINLTGLNIFDLIYIFMVCPFSYFGPVVAGFANRSSSRMSMTILISVTIGLGCVIIGTATATKFLVDGAATFALLASLVSAFLFSTKQNVLNSIVTKYETESISFT